MLRATPKDHPLYDPRGGDAYWRIECMLLEFGATQWVARGSNPGVVIISIPITNSNIYIIYIIVYHYCYYYFHHHALQIRWHTVCCAGLKPRSMYVSRQLTSLFFFLAQVPVI